MDSEPDEFRRELGAIAISLARLEEPLLGVEGTRVRLGAMATREDAGTGLPEAAVRVGLALESIVGGMRMLKRVLSAAGLEGCINREACEGHAARDIVCGIQTPKCSDCPATTERDEFIAALVNGDDQAAAYWAYMLLRKKGDPKLQELPSFQEGWREFRKERMRSIPREKPDDEPPANDVLGRRDGAASPTTTREFSAAPSADSRPAVLKPGAVKKRHLGGANKPCAGRGGENTLLEP